MIKLKGKDVLNFEKDLELGVLYKESLFDNSIDFVGEIVYCDYLKYNKFIKGIFGDIICVR